MVCDMCGTEYGKGQGFHGTRYKQAHFCSQNCYEQYIKLKSAPKPPINFKPEKSSDRRIFTDYIQDWTNDEANWSWIMKQAKDIMEEFELNWKQMYAVLKYCKEYEELDWDLEFGLYQFFPRYIQPMKDFAKTINQFKKIDFEDDEIKYVKKPKNTIGKVEF